jgi:hypothetical protein
MARDFFFVQTVSTCRPPAGSLKSEYSSSSGSDIIMEKK